MQKYPPIFKKMFLNDVALLWMRVFMHMIPLVSHNKMTPISVRAHLHYALKYVRDPYSYSTLHFV